jgi:hypothetical protein
MPEAGDQRPQYRGTAAIATVPEAGGEKRARYLEKIRKMAGD